jgi:hypothetical protein
LQDFAQQRFLDRFVYRNPKSAKKTKKAAEAGGENDEESTAAPTDVTVTTKNKIVNRKRAYNPWGVKR